MQSDFLTEQKKYPRVRDALEKKEKLIVENLKNNGIEQSSLQILITAYKAEKKLHIYGKNHGEDTIKLIAEYDICRSSGNLGPKREQGDNQIPEGFYHIDRFNPSSNYHLSLGINYPNASDKKKGLGKNLGGDIFIHGSCVTIGCLPMTDDKIKEIYLYAAYAKNNGQNKIPVYIFPFQMSDDNFKRRAENQHVELNEFWKNLKEGYDIFEKEKKILSVSVDANGNYLF
jgi:murein L,D-transpeptidase YafK